MGDGLNAPQADSATDSKTRGGRSPEKQKGRMENKPQMPDKHLALAIITTLLCCLPTGIVAIIKATKVESLYHAGDYAGAEKASKEAKGWSLIGLWIAVAGWVVYILAMVIGVASLSY